METPPDDVHRVVGVWGCLKVKALCHCLSHPFLRMQKAVTKELRQSCSAVRKNRQKMRFITYLYFCLLTGRGSVSFVSTFEAHVSPYFLSLCNVYSLSSLLPLFIYSVWLFLVLIFSLCMYSESAACTHAHSHAERSLWLHLYWLWRRPLSAVPFFPFVR